MNYYTLVGYVTEHRRSGTTSLHNLSLLAALVPGDGETWSSWMSVGRVAWTRITRKNRREGERGGTDRVRWKSFFNREKEKGKSWKEVSIRISANAPFLIFNLRIKFVTKRLFTRTIHYRK